MESLRNLYDLEKETKISNKKFIKYAEDHDFEIGYQKYYNFLIKDFYSFLQKYLIDYGKGKDNVLYEGNMQYFGGEPELTFKVDPIMCDCIKNFIEGERIGTVRILSTEDNICTINVPLKGSVKDIITAFYNELQRVEMSMKTKEEMQEELEHFKATDGEWITRKNELDTSAEYLSFLNSLFKYINDERNGISYSKHVENLSIIYIMNFYYDNEGVEINSISKFLKFYKLGNCTINRYDKFVKIKFTASLNEIETAYYQEMQRIEHLSNGIKR